MLNIMKIAIGNLLRYRRRTILTASLITIGVVFVIIYISVSGSFKNIIIGQITDSMLAHIQIHRKGFVASIDSLPLNLSINEENFQSLEKILQQEKSIEAYSPRIKFGGMFSNFAETTNVRLNGVYPDKEFATVPLLLDRIMTTIEYGPQKKSNKSKMKNSKAQDRANVSLKPGEILVPELLARGMKVKLGDTVVIVATNRDGSVNGRQFTVAGILSSLMGPGGRDGYVHFQDAMELLRMEKKEVSEIAIRIKKFDKLNMVHKKLLSHIKPMQQNGKPIFEVHTWEGLSPFVNIAKMIDIMTLFIRVLLVTIVLISIMNVMIMAVYERIREIGTIAAIGTLPEKILYMFLTEGFFLGLVGTVAGLLVSGIIMVIINVSKFSFNFGMQKGIALIATISVAEILLISVTVMLVSIAAAFYPAYTASRMEPVDALRYR